MSIIYWVIGGEFSSLNFHTINPETVTTFGPYKTRQEAEDIWKHQSYLHKANASYRFLIAEEPNTA